MTDVVTPTVVESTGISGGWFMWVFFLFFLLAWGRGGLFGNRDNFAGTNSVNNDFLYTNLNNTLGQGFSNIIGRQYEQAKEVLQGFNAMGRDMCTLGSNIMQGLNDNSFRAQENAYNLSSQLAQLGFNNQQCCCETNRNLDSIKYENAQNTCAITSAIHAEGEATRALINANVMQDLRDRLEARDRDLLTANFQLSQQAQNATLLSALRPNPIPAYITCSPYQTSNFSYCGCN